MENQAFYFTYGTSQKHAHKGGYSKIYAPNICVAEDVFNYIYPNETYAFCYTEDDFISTNMDTYGNYGYGLFEEIESYNGFYKKTLYSGEVKPRKLLGPCFQYIVNDNEKNLLPYIEHLSLNDMYKINQDTGIELIINDGKIIGYNFDNSKVPVVKYFNEETEKTLVGMER